MDRHRTMRPTLHAPALVGLVRSGSPAAKAGLRRGDLVVRFGNQEVRAADQLTVALRQSQIGVPVPASFGPAHVIPQPPQWFGSLLVSTHSPGHGTGHHVSPAGQSQTCSPVVEPFFV